ncbi:hypothetical protein [Streptomyces olivaceus]|uniref:hypothetical protein n=1 Tax=Streptomyces olivaceus TaxID=47716 RepID=UPI001CCD4A65|nr:hypothetical protein [Streptomyces olivaceus]MBZ6135769.1 hypothetical protein [Streptomyces olivaceus]
MRIRILAAGQPGAVLYDRPWPAVGDVVDDLPTTVAAHLVASEVAEEVADSPPPARRRKSRRGDDDG